MFVQPKYAGLLNKGLVSQILGAPPPQPSIASAPSPMGEIPVHLTSGDPAKASR